MRDWITTTSLSLLQGHPLFMPSMFARRPLLRSWVILLTERHKNRMTNHITPPVSAE